MVASSHIVIAAQKCLCVGKKRISSSTCLNLTVQILAVDLGVKYAMLYDCNAATPEQIQLFLKYLQEFGIVKNTLRMLSIDDNTIIFNPAAMESYLNELLQNKRVFLIDISPSRKLPVFADFEERTENMIKTLSGFIINWVDKSSSVTVVENELYNEWNLCTLFGILLGYPATYWFDQTKGFENCLSMIPLARCTVRVKWQMNDINNCCCLYSFSIPDELWGELQDHMQQWTESLRERFNKQTILADLCFTRDIITLPAVTL